MEMKVINEFESFNESDEKKLIELSNEESLLGKSQKIVDNFLKSKNKPHEKIDDIKFFLDVISLLLTSSEWLTDKQTLKSQNNFLMKPQCQL